MQLFRVAGRNYRKKTSLLSWNSPSDFSPPWQIAVFSLRRKEPDGSHISNGCVSTWQTPSQKLAATAGSFTDVCGGKWLRECEYFIFFFSLFFFFLSPKQVWNRWGNTLPARAAPQTHRLHLHLHGVDGGLWFSVSSAIFTNWIHCKWSKDELPRVTTPLARLLTFYIHTKCKNRAEFSLR